MGASIDYTKIPGEMEKRFDQYDESNALRPTVINTGIDWKLSFQKNLLSPLEDRIVAVQVRIILKIYNKYK